MPPAPAPANDSVAFLSPFFTPSATAPLSERRDCNNAIACCPAVSKVPAAAAAAAACALRRGASFLDAGDACLALPDKASFLIPEDSYLPGQENCASAVPAAPAPSPLGCSARAQARAVPLTTAAACRNTSPGCTALALQRQQQLSTPFLLLDSAAFAVLACDDEHGFEDDSSLFAIGGGGGGARRGGVDAASECFEKAVQALEMVEQRSLVQAHDHPDHLHSRPADPSAMGTASLQQPDSSVAATAMPYDTAAYGDDAHIAQRRASSMTGSAAAADPPLSPSPASAATPSALLVNPHQQHQHQQFLLPQVLLPPLGPLCEKLPPAGEAPQRPASVGPALLPAGAAEGEEAQAAAVACPYVVSPDGVSCLPGCFPAGWMGGMGLGVMPTGYMPGAAGGEQWQGGADGGAIGGAQAAAAVEPPPQALPPPKAFHHKTGGPCDHCGATESPQWRRGPPAKPMLCNACGTRYRRTNQLNPAAAYTPAGRAAAAAAAAAAQQQQLQAALKQRGGSKREGHCGSGASAAKRGRGAY